MSGGSTAWRSDSRSPCGARRVVRLGRTIPARPFFMGAWRGAFSKNRTPMGTMNRGFRGAGRPPPEARRAERTVAHGVSHGCCDALDFKPRRGDQNRPRGVGICGNAGCSARPCFSDRPSGALVILGGRVPRLTPWARVLPPRPGLEMDGSWRAPCSTMTCSRPMKRGRRGITMRSRSTMTRGGEVHGKV